MNKNQYYYEEHTHEKYLNNLHESVQRIQSREPYVTQIIYDKLEQTFFANKDYHICIEGALSGEGKNSDALYLAQMFIKHSNQDDQLVDLIVKYHIVTPSKFYKQYRKNYTLPPLCPVYELFKGKFRVKPEKEYRLTSYDLVDMHFEEGVPYFKKLPVLDPSQIILSVSNDSVKGTLKSSTMSWDLTFSGTITCIRNGSETVFNYYKSPKVEFDMSCMYLEGFKHCRSINHFKAMCTLLERELIQGKIIWCNTFENYLSDAKYKMTQELDQDCLDMVERIKKLMDKFTREQFLEMKTFN